MYKKTILIPQEDNIGCGLSCVAMVIGKSYSDVAKKIPEMYKKVQKRGMFCRDIVTVLKLFGITARWDNVNKSNIKQIEQDDTIVYISKVDHFFVKVDKGWHDSWVNRPKMNPVKAGIIKQLPSKPNFVIFVQNKPEYKKKKTS